MPHRRRRVRCRHPPHAVARSDYVRKFVADPILAGLARDLVGPDVRLYWRAGSIVVFTSLTPHATKRNRTNAVATGSCATAYAAAMAARSPDGPARHVGGRDRLGNVSARLRCRHGAGDVGPDGPPVDSRYRRPARRVLLQHPPATFTQATVLGSGVAHDEHRRVGLHGDDHEHIARSPCPPGAAAATGFGYSDQLLDDERDALWHGRDPSSTAHIRARSRGASPRSSSRRR